MVEELLQPISAEKPAGDDQSSEPEWQALKEARRADDKFNRGSWDRPLKESDWRAVRQFSVELLSQKTKDLRLAVFFTEANLNLDAGFSGLSESLRLIRGLIANFWGSGLFPPIEDGDAQYRAQALDWLGDPDKFPHALRAIQLTQRSDGGSDYSWLDFDDARRVGWEKDLLSSTGDIDEAKAQRRAASLANGHISREMFETAVTASPRAALESISNDLETAWADFLALDKEIEDKFGDQGPGLQSAKDAFEDCRTLIGEMLKKKREQEPDASPSGQVQAGAETASPKPWVAGFAFDDALSASDFNGSWQSAENLIKAGNVKEGLAEMTRLAAAEHGRAKFQRKLRLAETCFAIQRERLAISILEELARQIDEHHLEAWESAELLGRVWGRLYRCYKSSDTQNARGAELFERLCRLDPWQALRWED
jgi:type VI secretion system protein ImpA